MISFLNKAGGAGKPNIFIQEDEPAIKDGIWFKKAKSNYNKLIVADAISASISEKLLSKKISGFYWENTPVVDNEIYFFGRSSGETTSTKYNIVTGEETAIASPSFWKCRPLVAIGTDIYLFVGSGAMGFSVYNTLTDTYSTKNTTPEWYYGGGNAVLYNNEIYLFGFFGSNNLAKAYRYNPEDNTWYSLATPPITVADSNNTFLTNIIGDNVYIYYGTSAYKYDIINNTYTELTAVPVDTKLATSFVVNSTIYIVGGSSKSNSCISYDISADTYTVLDDLINTVTYGGAAVINNTVYITGAVNNTTGNMLSLTFISVSFAPNSVVIHNGNTYSTALLTQPANTEGKLVTKFNNIYTTDNAGELITTEEKYYGNGTEWVLIN